MNSAGVEQLTFGVAEIRNKNHQRKNDRMCRTCRIVLPRESFRGRTTVCAACADSKRDRWLRWCKDTFEQRLADTQAKTPFLECTGCHQVKPLYDFQKRSDTRTGYRERCRMCFVSQQTRLRNASLKKYQATTVHRLYAIEPTRYLNMRQEQMDLCAICGRPEHGGRWKSTLAVDHDHTSGHIRGLLCTSCNRGLGFFEDDQKLLRKAISYLERARAVRIAEEKAGEIHEPTLFDDVG